MAKPDSVLPQVREQVAHVPALTCAKVQPLFPLPVGQLDVLV